MMIGAFRRSLYPLGFVVAFSALSQRALAQTEEDRAAARALATQGINAYNEKRHADALDLFSRAESLLHAPPHVLYMARSAAQLGQLVRARELYLKLGREELPANAPQAFRDAQNEAREEVKGIEPRLANITINVKAPAGVAYKLEMDKKPISSAVVGVPLPADPGKHQVVAFAPGYRSKPAEVTLAEGGRGAAEVVLEATGEALPPASPTGPAPAAGPAATPAPAGATTASFDGSNASKGDSWMRPTSYVAMGVGVLGLGAGTYFGLKSRSERKDADSLANQCESPCLKSDPITSQIDSKDEDARKHMTLSVVGFVVGGVGAATGVTLFLLSNRRAEKTAYVTPFVGPGSAGLSGAW